MSKSSSRVPAWRDLAKLSVALLPALLLLILCLAPAPAAAAPRDTTASLGELCAMSGGSHATNGSLFSCCWAGWGCMRCHANADGTVDEGVCWVDCYTQACSDANARTLLGLPPKKTPKSKVQTIPGANTLQ